MIAILYTIRKQIIVFLFKFEILQEFLKKHLLCLVLVDIRLNMQLLALLLAVIMIIISLGK